MMKIWRASFNLFLAVVAAGLVAGCQSSPKKDQSAGNKKKSNSKKELSTLRFFQIINYDGTARCLAIQVYRQNPMTWYIDRSPFLWEASVTKASVTTNFGTYGLQIEFDRSGAGILDNVTSALRGQHIAIYSDFSQSRWLAAPIITHRITNGVFEFTPDASREETERIARGLNNLAKKTRSALDKPKKEEKSQ